MTMNELQNKIRKYTRISNNRYRYFTSDTPFIQHRKGMDCEMHVRELTRELLALSLASHVPIPLEYSCSHFPDNIAYNCKDPRHVRVDEYLTKRRHRDDDWIAVNKITCLSYVPRSVPTAYNGIESSTTNRTLQC